MRFVILEQINWFGEAHLLFRGFGIQHFEIGALVLNRVRRTGRQSSELIRFLEPRTLHQREDKNRANVPSEIRVPKCEP